ncbi:MAG: NADH-quinone oxidoreductase subunit A [Phycisphaerae bacterium]
MMFAIPPAVAQGSTYAMQWGLILILFFIALGFAVGNVVISQLLGPSRKGRTKDTSYESGVEPLGSTRDRFNVRFYLVAMIFLVFDVEVLFLLPWITIFNKSKNTALHLAHSPLFGSVLLFSAILLVAYVYAWGKGVFKWD